MTEASWHPPRELDLDRIRRDANTAAKFVGDSLGYPVLSRDVPALCDEIERLRARLEAAEQACVLFGRTASAGNSDCDKAATQAWIDWNHAYGRQARQPTGDEVRTLVERRDAIREATLARIRGEESANV